MENELKCYLIILFDVWKDNICFSILTQGMKMYTLLAVLAEICCDIQVAIFLRVTRWRRILIFEHVSLQEFPEVMQNDVSTSVIAQKLRTQEYVMLPHFFKHLSSDVTTAYIGCETWLSNFSKCTWMSMIPHWKMRTCSRLRRVFI